MVGLKKCLVGLLSISSLAIGGCDSAVITDAYMARDEEGARITPCIHPQAWGAYLVVEGKSFREDTLVWPELEVEREIDPVRGSLLMDDQGVIHYSDDELEEFRNWAPGKGDFKLILKGQRQEPTSDPPWPRGFYRWNLFLNNESSPAASVPWQVSEQCEFSPSVPN